jgi:HK97 family phage major capsid protein
MKEKHMDIDILNRAPEHKAGVPAEPFSGEDVLRIFETYKRENDARVAAIEKRKGDPLTEEKMARMDARIDSFTVKQARPPLGGARSEPQSYEAREHKSAFDAYVRHGESANLRALETKAMSVGSSADGGYRVPFETVGRVSEA